MENRKPGEPVIQVKDLYKIYRMGDSKVYALNGVDFTISRGEFCAITGPSGSGKSTLLNMLAGLEHPSKGEIVIAGKHIERLNERQLVAFRRERVGFIFQSYNLIATMNAIENVALPLSFRGMARKERTRRAKQYLKLVGLEKFMYHMPNQMSGGQQQRVGIARALITNPDIILMDEPFSALDPITRSQLQDELINIQTQFKKTIIFVTHDMDEAIKIADKICIMGKGRVIQYDDPETILKNPANEFVSNFVGKNRIWSSPEYIKVKDIMIEDPITCSQDISLLKCIKKMRYERVDTLLVIDRKGKLNGIITGKMIQKEKDHYKSVKEIMEQPRAVTSPDKSIVDILKEVTEKNLSSLPVTDENGILRGLITKSSLVTTLSQQFEMGTDSNEKSEKAV